MPETINNLLKEKASKEANERVTIISADLHKVLSKHAVTALEAEIIVPQMLTMYSQAAKANYIIKDKE